jgi:hypothetical protein
MAFLCSVPAQAQPDELPWVRVSRDQKVFVLDPSGRPFVPWGFNYDRDDKGRLIEDYWDDEWPTVEDDKPDTLAEALAALEKGLTRWFQEQGIEGEGRQ